MDYKSNLNNISSNNSYNNINSIYGNSNNIIKENDEFLNKKRDMNFYSSSSSVGNLYSNYNKNEINEFINFNPNKRIRRNRAKIIRDAITALAVCNNVTPIKINNEDNIKSNKYKENKNENENSLNTKVKNSSIKYEEDNYNNNYDKNLNQNQVKNQHNFDIAFKYGMLKEEGNSNNNSDNGYFDNYIENNNNDKVLEIKDKDNDNDKYEYQASSPDEVALVNFCEELNMKLIFRTDKLIKISNANDCIESYEILANFPFSSETKRMGIIVKNLKSDQIIFYLKGAENVIENYVKEDYKSYIKENSEILATNGLRTLVITQKLLDKELFEDWRNKYNQACSSMENRKEKVSQVISLLESNMEFLTVTGVEDQLQEEVNETIDSLKNAGIKIWMLTGDKVETALCISISTGLKNKDQKVIIIKDTKSEEQLKTSLEKLRYIGDFVLVIDGYCLEIALTKLEKLFFEVSMTVKNLLFLFKGLNIEYSLFIF